MGKIRRWKQELALQFWFHLRCGINWVLRKYPSLAIYPVIEQIERDEKMEAELNRLFVALHVRNSHIDESQRLSN